jgi:hypothetical protein
MHASASGASAELGETRAIDASRQHPRIALERLQRALDDAA